MHSALSTRQVLCLITLLEFYQCASVVGVLTHVGMLWGLEVYRSPGTSKFRVLEMSPPSPSRRTFAMKHEKKSTQRLLREYLAL